ncbi:uncharacterized, partial [Tachysurus ichikawai]
MVELEVVEVAVVVVVVVIVVKVVVVVEVAVVQVVVIVVKVVVVVVIVVKVVVEGLVVVVETSPKPLKSGKPSLHSFSLQLVRLCSQRLAEIQRGPVVRGSLTLESSRLISGPVAGKRGKVFELVSRGSVLDSRFSSALVQQQLLRDILPTPPRVFTLPDTPSPRVARGAQRRLSIDA